MNLEQKISAKIEKAFEPIHLNVLNESHKHAGPATESHFNILLVSALFESLPKVKRHQAVYKVLVEELAGPVHALALHLYSPVEWDSGRQTHLESPDCSKNK